MLDSVYIYKILSVYILWRGLEDNKLKYTEWILLNHSNTDLLVIHFLFNSDLNFRFSLINLLLLSWSKNAFLKHKGKKGWLTLLSGQGTETKVMQQNRATGQRDASSRKSSMTSLLKWLSLPSFGFSLYLTFWST